MKVSETGLTLSFAHDHSYTWGMVISGVYNEQPHQLAIYSAAGAENEIIFPTSGDPVRAGKLELQSIQTASLLRPLLLLLRRVLLPLGEADLARNPIFLFLGLL